MNKRRKIIQLMILLLILAFTTEPVVNDSNSKSENPRRIPHSSIEWRRRNTVLSEKIDNRKRVRLGYQIDSLIHNKIFVYELYNF
jgi:hypothetical protein